MLASLTWERDDLAILCFHQIQRNRLQIVILGTFYGQYYLIYHFGHTSFRMPL